MQDNEEQLFGYEVTVQRKWLDFTPHKYLLHENLQSPFYAGPWLKFIVGVKLIQTGNLQIKLSICQELIYI